MTLKNYAQKYRELILDEIGALFRSEELPPRYAHLHTHLSRFCTRGKTLRGVFVLLGHEMSGGRDLNNALKIAAALEVNGSALLIHDDIMDNDLLRRGESSIHAKYIDEGLRQHMEDPKNYGQSMGILVGDLAFFLSYQLLNQVDTDIQTFHRLHQQYIQDMKTTALGQVMDLEFAHTNYEPSVDQILHMYLCKTGRYTFANPFLMGAILAGAEESTLEAISAMCEKMGIIFQIKDDELGIFGDESETGKTVGSDIAENKKTYIRALFLEKASAKDKKKFVSYFGKKASKSDVVQVRNLIDAYDLRKDSQIYIETLTSDVLSRAEKLNLPENYKQVIFGLIHYNKSRAA